MRFEVYGVFGDVYVLFVEYGSGVLDMVCSETVDGIEVWYGSSMTMRVYYNGHYYKLQEAFDAQIIDHFKLESAVENYYYFYPFMDPDGEYSDTLSDELRAEIEACYGGAREEDDEDSVAGWHYYGTYNGYAILMCIGQLDWVEEKDIGGRIFSWSSGFTLIGFKNNLEYELEELYAMDHITQADLDELLMKHDAFYLEYIESLKSGDPIFS